MAEKGGGAEATIAWIHPYSFEDGNAYVVCVSMCVTANRPFELKEFGWILIFQDVRIRVTCTDLYES